MAWFVLLTLIRWITIYPVDSVIRPLNIKRPLNIIRTLNTIRPLNRYLLKDCKYVDLERSNKSLVVSWAQNRIYSKRYNFVVISVINTRVLVSVWSQGEALEPTEKASGEVTQTMLFINVITVYSVQESMSTQGLIMSGGTPWPK